MKQILRKYWFIVVIGIMILIFLNIAKGNDTLTAYRPDEKLSTYTIEETEETEKPLNMKEYQSSEIAVTMQIPEDWEKVIKDGCDTFIHAPSAAAIQIQVLSYYPAVNNITAESIAQTLNSRGCVLSDFNRTGMNNYLVSYQSEGDTGEPVDHLEYVIWDRSHVLKISVIVLDKHYERLSDYIWKSLDSIQWTYEDPITDGTGILYSPEGDFEIGLPSDWIYSIENGSIYANLEEAGCSMTANTLFDQSYGIGAINEVEYADFAANGRQNFLLSSFQTDDKSVYAEATYQMNGMNMDMMQYYYTNGTTHYIITFDIPETVIGDYYELCLSCIREFRTFTEEKEPETEVFTEASTSAQKETESIESVIKEPESGDVEVSSFAEAILQCVSIPTEKAEEISQIWNSLNAGTLTYLQAVKESTENMILYMKTITDIDYYMTIEKSTGNLLEIRIGAEDGQILYPTS